MRSKILIPVTIAMAVCSPVGLSAEKAIEEVVVTTEQIKRVYFLEDEISVAPDSAQLIKKVPGGNVNGNGPLTGIPQYRGMYGPRIGVTVNGARLAPAGPNWMDPPLSYVAPAQLVRLEVYRGIAPVSIAQETIGGAITSETLRGEFSDSSEFSSSGRLSVSSQSVNDASMLNGVLSLANDSHYLTVAAMTEQAHDAEFDGGRILPSEYDRQRAEIVYGYQSGRHKVSLAFARNETGEAGTPALPMDIDFFDGDIFNLEHNYDGDQWEINTNLFGSNLDHGMSNFNLRPSPGNRAMWRRNTTRAENRGFSVKALHDGASGDWLVGVDYFEEMHDSLIDNPNNAMFFVDSFDNAQREVLGVFVERQQAFNDRVHGEFGLRINQVDMSADEVDATPARMMPPARLLRDTFNASDRTSSDTNVDAVAKLWWRTSENLAYYAGLAHKTRSPSYQERYLWLPLQATGGLSDGLTYTGNLALDPEQAVELELGFDLHGEAFSIAPRIFYREVNDYIQGTPSTNQAAVMFVNMMNRVNGTNNPAPLQFNNVDAVFWGLDFDWRYKFNQRWSASGLLSYIRGERDDIDDNLYRITPSNLSVALEYQAERWGANAELTVYDDQDDVSATNREQATEGYELLAFQAWYQHSDRLRLALGVQNALDEQYLNHLTGYNRVRNPDVAVGDRLPGFGRNLFLRADYKW